MGEIKLVEPQVELRTYGQVCHPLHTHGKMADDNLLVHIVKSKRTERGQNIFLFN